MSESGLLVDLFALAWRNLVHTENTYGMTYLG